MYLYKNPAIGRPHNLSTLRAVAPTPLGRTAPATATATQTATGTDPPPSNYPHSRLVSQESNFCS